MPGLACGGSRATMPHAGAYAGTLHGSAYAERASPQAKASAFSPLSRPLARAVCKRAVKAEAVYGLLREQASGSCTADVTSPIRS